MTQTFDRWVLLLIRCDGTRRESLERGGYPSFDSEELPRYNLLVTKQMNFEVKADQ